MTRDDDSRETKLEIELPCRVVGRCVAVLVHECETELDDLEEIYVAAKQLILVIGCGTELADGSRDDT